MSVEELALIESLAADTDVFPGPVQEVRSAQWPACIDVLGLPITPFRFEETLDAVEYLIGQSLPAYFITANTHYAMLTANDARLRRLNREAAFLVADGMPLVWSGRLGGRPIPQRVAGADLVPALCGRAADRGFRVFLLGAREGVGSQAAERLQELYPGLQIAGVEWPQISRLTARQTEALEGRIRDSEADLVFAALGQPLGELWLADHYRNLGHAVCCQVGASIDFVAGQVRRAPAWMRRTGLEWSYRLSREPSRLTGRYARNAWFLARASLASVPGVRGSRPSSAGTAALVEE